MLRFLLFLMVSCFSLVECFGQPREVTFSQLEVLMKEDPKPVVVFLHTDWCSYCALMERKTFSDKEVQDNLDENFYFVSFNAETESDIYFRKHLFSFKKKGIKSGVHELALALGKENAYPAVVVLNEDYQIIYQHFAYMRPVEMNKLLSTIN